MSSAPELFGFLIFYNSSAKALATPLFLDLRSYYQELFKKFSQNPGEFKRHYKVEFIKQVFPILFKPTSPIFDLDNKGVTEAPLSDEFEFYFESYSCFDNYYLLKS